VSVHLPVYESAYAIAMLRALYKFARIDPIVSIIYRALSMILELIKFPIVELQVCLQDSPTDPSEDVIAKPADAYLLAVTFDRNSHTFATKDIVVCVKYLAIV